jgi:MFS family permease
LFSLLFRVVINSQSLLLAFHVRHTLHLSYGDAGLLSAVVYLCMAATELRRGPRIDRSGLRRTMAPAIVINGICWLIAPFVPFPLLLILGAVAGWFEIPVINIAKQAMLIAATERERRTALVADAVLVDVSLLIGPPLGVAAMNMWNTTAVLFMVRLLAVGCGIALFVQNPPLRTGAWSEPQRVPMGSWLRPGFLFACIGYAAAIAVLSAEEISVITMMHDFNAKEWIGLVLAMGAAGGVAGGYGYGAISRVMSPYVMLVGLGAAVVPCALAPGPVSLAVAVLAVGVLAGAIFPACTARMDSYVFEEAQGQAIGFHFSLMWVGIAVGGLMASQAIDFGGSSGGFLLAAGIGIGAGIGLGAIAARAAPTPGASDRISRSQIAASTARVRRMSAAVTNRLFQGRMYPVVRVVAHAMYAILLVAGGGGNGERAESQPMPDPVEHEPILEFEAGSLALDADVPEATSPAWEQRIPAESPTIPSMEPEVAVPDESELRSSPTPWSGKNSVMPLLHERNAPSRDRPNSPTPWSGKYGPPS